MLNLNNLRSLLAQLLSQSPVRIAALLSPEGKLVSYAADLATPKDEVRVIVGLSSEIWQETKDQGVGMVESELGRVVVLPVQDAPKTRNNEKQEPLLLLALTADSSVEWSEIERSARELAKYLERPAAELRERLAVAPTSPIALRPSVR
ncbi:hypothetical protein ABKN59_002708 [Abortiporus biennis]